MLHGVRAAVALCFLEKPVQGISTTFIAATPNTKTHLSLLSQLAFALFEPTFKAAITRRASEEEIMRELRRVEASITERKPSTER